MTFFSMRKEYIMVIKIPINDKRTISLDVQDNRNMVTLLKFVGSKRVIIEDKLPRVILLFKSVKTIPLINPISKSPYFCIFSPLLTSS